MKKGYFTGLKGNAEEGYDFDAFLEYKYNRFRFLQAEVVKIDGKIINENERGWILASTKPIGGKCELSGEVPTKEQFFRSELKKIKTRPSPDPDNTFTFNVVPKYKAQLETKLGKDSKPPKEYDSFRRVMAFYILLLHKNNLFSISEIISKTKIMKKVVKLKNLGEINSLTVYLTITCGYKNESAFYKNEGAPSDYSKDYNYAEKLYRSNIGSTFKSLQSVNS